MTVQALAKTKMEVPPLTVGDLMSPGVKTAKLSDTLSHVHSLMRLAGFRHLPVVDDAGKLVGILSDRNVLLAWTRGLETPVRAFMTRYTESIHPDTPARDAAARMLHDKIGSLVVVNRHHEVVGIITETDFLRVAHRAITLHTAIATAGTNG